MDEAKNPQSARYWEGRAPRKQSKSTGKKGRSSLEQVEHEEWDLRDFKDKNVFSFAPPHPENGMDPWSTLLEPLLKKDNERCAIWKDEVQNLLIFAGLFSAVVTAFLVESYKTLQVDSQSQMVMLLSHIVLRLDDPNFTAPLLEPFTADAASIRVNSLWFISLVLSLTTVLVGIISLQWLRVHQNHSGLTPKESFAVIRMRRDGMKRWHVPKVFAGLPLLLQTALVLFLVGLVDFVRPFGIIDVTVPVLIAIGLTLFFLLATTVLPTLQGLALYIPFWYTDNILYAPSQCPYKSPQSRAFRLGSSFAFRLADRLHHYLGPSLRSLFQWFLSLSGPAPSSRTINFSRAIRLVSETWRQRSRQGYDLSWISLRDAFSRETFDKDGTLALDGSSLESLSSEVPLFDIAAGVCEAAQEHCVRGDDLRLSAAYHCFSDLSQSIVDRFASTKYNYFGLNRRHEAWHLLRHFQSLIGHDPDQRLSMFDYLDLPPYGIFDMGKAPNGIRERSNLLYHEFMAIFLNDIPHPNFRLHLAEIQIRVMQWLYGSQHKLHPSSVSLVTGQEPLCMSMDVLEREILCNIPKSGILPVESTEFQELLWQCSNILLRFFECAGSDKIGSTDNWNMNVHTGAHIPGFLWGAYTFLSDTGYQSVFQDLKDAETVFASIMDVIRDQLDSFLLNRLQVLDEEKNGVESQNLNVLFYTSVLLIRRLKISGVPDHSRLQGHVYRNVDNILPTLARYKQDFLDIGGPDALLEQRYHGSDRGITRFTQEWWDFLYDRCLGESLEDGTGRISAK